jgi:amino acid transporter, AAT family
LGLGSCGAGSRSKCSHSLSLEGHLLTTCSIVGVSNQLAWISIGITSIRFRAALARQGKTHLLPFKNWTYPWGPWICVILNAVIILVQGWSCFSPSFDAVSFVSFYIELPVMLLMYVGWKLVKRTHTVRLDEMDLDTDTYTKDEEKPLEPGWRARLRRGLWWFF